MLVDVVDRTIREALARGPIYRIVRMVKHGPLCPAVILWVETQHEPGEPDNDMAGTRSPFVAAFLSGQPTDPARLFAMGKAGSAHITRAEYDRAVAEITANVRANVYDPRCQPYVAVDIESLPLPFAEV